MAFTEHERLRARLRLDQESFRELGRWIGGNVVEPPFVNVKLAPYNATGDGSTDDTAAVQAALTAAKAAGGGTVYFPRGTYCVRGLLLSEASKISLKGEDGAVLKGPGVASPGWDKIIRFDYCTDISLQNLKIDNWRIDRFGGLEFYDCQRVWIDRCHAYNSDVTANTGDKDRRSFYFFTNSPTLDSENEDIWITNCLIEDMQLEIHCAKNVFVHNNIVRRGPVTGGILLITAVADGGTVENVWVTNNIVEDADGGAIYLTLEGQWNNHTFRNIHINNNSILMGRTPDANNPLQEGNRAIMLGTVNNGDASTGNIIHDCEIVGNLVRVTAASVDLECQELIFVNNSVTANWDIRRLNVSNNVIYGNGTGTGISLRRISDSQVFGNQIYNTAEGVHVSVVSGNTVRCNSSNTSSKGFEADFSGSTGGNDVRDNLVRGTPASRYVVSGTLDATDFVESERLSFSAAYGNAGNAVANGEAYHQDITVTNAAAGDPVSVSMSSINTSGIQVTANVISANTVRVSIFNHSDAPRTFGAGTIRGFVTRMH